jgi:hypothetical protein
MQSDRDEPITSRMKLAHGWCGRRGKRCREATARGRDLIVDKVPSQRRKYRSGRPHPATSAERAGLPEERKFHVVSGGGYERVQPGVRMLSGGPDGPSRQLLCANGPG